MRSVITRVILCIGLLVGVLPTTGCESSAPNVRSGPANAPSGPGTPSQPSQPSAPTPEAQALTIPRPRIERAGSSTTDAAGVRVVLVAADRYADSSLNDVPFVRPTAETLRDTLTDGLGLPEEHVTLLSGDAVVRETIRENILARSAELAGDSSLVVIWIGHGFTQAEQPHLLTRHSRTDPNTTYSHSLAHADLSAWMGAAKRDVQERGGRLTTGLIVDACRTRTLGAPRRLLDYKPSVDVEAFSAQVGVPAAARPGTQEALFSGALARALGRARGERVGLRAALEQACRVAAEQGAEITTGDSDLILVDRANLSVRIEAYDALSGQTLGSARARLNGVERDVPARFDGLTATSGDTAHDLLVVAPNYFPAEHGLELAAGDIDLGLRVGLQPEFALLTGSVQFASGGAVRASVSTSAGPLAETLGVAAREHFPTTAVLSASGPFELRVPRLSEPLTLRLHVDGRLAREWTFRMDERPSLTRLVAGQAVTEYAFGAQVLRTEAPTSIGAGARRLTVGSVDVDFRFDRLGGDDFTDSRGQAFYEEIVGLIDRGEFRQAGLDVRSLLNQGRVVAASETVLRELLAEVHLAEALSDADRERRAGRTPEAIARLAEPDLRERPRVQTLLHAWHLELAKDLHAQGEFEAALGHLDAAHGVRSLADYRTQVDMLLGDWMESAFAGAVEDGEWSRARDIVGIMTVRGRDELGDDWSARIERESIGPQARAAFRDAVDRLAAGEHEAALRALEDAETAGLNAHYEDQARGHRRRIEERLFTQFNAAGAQAWRADEPVAALEAYLKAFEHDPLVASRLRGLVTNETVLGQAPELAERAQRALDADPPPARIDQRRSTATTIPGFSYVGENAQGLPEYDKDLGGGVSMRFVRIPAGEFSMGSPSGEEGRYDDEGPQHRVRVGEFLLAKTECTQAQWQAVMGSSPSRFNGTERPVEQVSWDDVQDFERKTGLRLPSEAEWEYAARAGSTGARHGDLDSVAWYGGNAGESTHPVARKQANAFGLHDMLGNVWEWCEDTWHGSYSGAPSDGSAWVDAGSSNRVTRGGSWDLSARICRSAYRDRLDPSYRYSILGFRPAFTLPIMDAKAPSAPASTRRQLPTEAIPGFSYVGENAQGLPEYDKDLGGGVSMRFVRVPAGEFVMGSPEDEVGRDSREGPQHRVRVGEFLVAKTECTQAQWRMVMGSSPSYFGHAGDDAPVERVSWEDAQDFGRKTGLRLPSEAEWEYACRAGSTTEIYTGRLSLRGAKNGPELDAIAWYGGNSGVGYAGSYVSSSWSEKQYDHSRAGTHLVGLKQANAFGLHDMLGNVGEWCEDAWHGSYSGAPTAGIAWLDPGSSFRVLRGGSWDDDATSCRSATRRGFAPSHRRSNLGFRPALSLPVADAQAALALASTPRQLRTTAIPGFSYVGENAQGLPEYDKDLGGGVSMRFVRIPAGEFTMGSPDGEDGRDSDEGPQHRVRVGEFLLAKTECTQAQWQAVMNTNPSFFVHAGDDAPVEQVSWEDVQEFERKTGLRLPSEAEWEYACRAGSTTALYTGPLTLRGANDGPQLDAIAWYGGNSGVKYEGGYDSSGWSGKQFEHSRAGTHPVGQKQANAFGLHDMLGNVYEWCADTWHGSYSGAPSDGSAWVDSGSSNRVIRGGCWNHDARACRSAHRLRRAPSNRYSSLGFRPAFTLP